MNNLGYRAFSEELQCYWRGWAVSGKKCLTLYLAPGSCCDMKGAVDIATRIMPDVEKIQIYSGAATDILYRKHMDGEWGVHSMPQPFISNPPPPSPNTHSTATE